MAYATLGQARASAPVRARFYMWMGWAFVLVSVVGFMPTYFMPMAQAKFHEPPIVHIHGLIMFSWVTLFAAQATLAARGQIADHRAWGMLGLALVAAMTFAVTWVETMRIHAAAGPGVPPAVAQGVRAFSWVTLGGLLFILGAFALAVVNIRRPEVHKRLMLLLTCSMMTPPIARWFLTFMAPPPDPSAPPLPAGVEASPPTFVAIPPALVGDAMLLAAIVYDWRTRGRPHPVYLVGGAVLLAYQLTVTQVGESAAWQSAAAWIGALAG